jgi:hypothetical protein
MWISIIVCNLESKYFSFLGTRPPLPDHIDLDSSYRKVLEVGYFYIYIFFFYQTASAMSSCFSRGLAQKLRLLSVGPITFFM